MDITLMIHFLKPFSGTLFSYKVKYIPLTRVLKSLMVQRVKPFSSYITYQFPSFCIFSSVYGFLYAAHVHLLF